MIPIKVAQAADPADALLGVGLKNLWYPVCPSHGVEVRCDGTVTKVPGSPGCKLEGSRPTLSFHVQERHGAVFLFNSDENIETPPPLQLPEELESAEYSHFLCYTE